MVFKVLVFNESMRKGFLKMPEMILVLIMVVVFIFLAIKYLLGRPKSESFDPTLIDEKAINDPTVRRLLREGARVGAVRYYNMLTGCGVRVAKQAIGYVIQQEYANVYRQLDF